MYRIVAKVVFLFLLLISSSISAQKNYPATQMLESKLIRTTESLWSISQSKLKSAPNGKKAKPGVHKKKNWPQHKIKNPKALPKGLDPVLQSGNANVTIINETNSFDGQDFTGVDPADPSIGMSNNHIIQMVNSAFGSLIEIYDLNGNLIAGPVTLDNITGIEGLGDPIVLYDQIADRWILSEIIAGQNGITYAVSQTADPLGVWNVFSLITSSFPDYQKWSMWSDFYLITVHENPNTAYAIERSVVLAGGAGAGVLQFTFPVVNNIAFHSVAPVHLTGFTAPPTGDPAWGMRVMDDAWDPSITSDHIELWGFGVDWLDLSNSFLAGPIVINTAAFDTDLCGYNSFSCIPQMGSAIRLDPIKEMFMHQVQYRNFGTHESIVMAHTIDVDGNDRAGIRWYELRSTAGSAWAIHQQSTFSPDTEGRFMPSIGINVDGDILLAYNKSGNNTFPSLYATARTSADALNSMTATEHIIKSGTAANSSNRFGDYNHLVVDPSDDRLFCFTGMYNASADWSTRINCMNISQATLASESLILQGVSNPGYNSLLVDLSESAETAHIEIFRTDDLSNDFVLIEHIEPEFIDADEFRYSDYDILNSNTWYYKIKHLDSSKNVLWSDVLALRSQHIDDFHIDITPNPFESDLVFRVNGSVSDARMDVKITDLLGRVVYQNGLNMEQEQTVISTNSFHSGIYLIQVFQAGHLVKTQKMVKS